jgi:hypothetical protein
MLLRNCDGCCTRFGVCADDDKLFYAGIAGALQTFVYRDSHLVIVNMAVGVCPPSND